MPATSLSVATPSWSATAPSPRARPALEGASTAVSVPVDVPHPRGGGSRSQRAPATRSSPPGRFTIGETTRKKSRPPARDPSVTDGAGVGRRAGATPSPSKPDWRTPRWARFAGLVGLRLTGRSGCAQSQRFHNRLQSCGCVRAAGRRERSTSDGMPTSFVSRASSGPSRASPGDPGISGPPRGCPHSRFTIGHDTAGALCLRVCRPIVNRPRASERRCRWSSVRVGATRRSCPSPPPRHAVVRLVAGRPGSGGRARAPGVGAPVVGGRGRAAAGGRGRDRECLPRGRPTGRAGRRQPRGVDGLGATAGAPATPSAVAPCWQRSAPRGRPAAHRSRSRA